IPADMVVNAMIVAMAMSHANDRGIKMIYHVSSSVSNPVRFTNLHDYGFRYFTNHPWITTDGKSIKVGKCLILSSMDRFRLYMAIHYFLPLK
ncbi:alcohol-forming fatty acyl-CoA reductase, partial [Sarracenia purpurea var. burkii]